MSGVKKIGLFLVSLFLGQQHTEAEMVWSSPQQCTEERERGTERVGVWRVVRRCVREALIEEEEKCMGVWSFGNI